MISTLPMQKLANSSHFYSLLLPSHMINMDLFILKFSLSSIVSIYCKVEQKSKRKFQRKEETINKWITIKEVKSNSSMSKKPTKTKAGIWRLIKSIILCPG